MQMAFMHFERQTLLAPFFLLVVAFVGDAQEVQQIPFTSVYTTTHQKEMKNADDSFKVLKGNVIVYNAPYGPTLNDILRKDKNGAKNIFLTRGDDIDSAIEATRDVLLRNKGVDTPAFSGEKSDSNKFWVTAFLGSAPGGYFGFDAVERQDKTIRVRFSRKPPIALGQIQVRYYYWIELGSLEKGTYSLEILNSQSKELLMQRRVLIR